MHSVGCGVAREKGVGCRVYSVGCGVAREKSVLAEGVDEQLEVKGVG